MRSACPSKEEELRDLLAPAPDPADVLVEDLSGAAALVEEKLRDLLGSPELPGLVAEEELRGLLAPAPDLPADVLAAQLSAGADLAWGAGRPSAI